MDDDIKKEIITKLDLYSKFGDSNISRICKELKNTLDKNEDKFYLILLNKIKEYEKILNNTSVKRTVILNMIKKTKIKETKIDNRHSFFDMIKGIRNQYFS